MSWFPLDSVASLLCKCPPLVWIPLADGIHACGWSYLSCESWDLACWGTIRVFEVALSSLLWWWSLPWWIIPVGFHVFIYSDLQNRCNASPQHSARSALQSPVGTTLCIGGNKWSTNPWLQIRPWVTWCGPFLTGIQPFQNDNTIATVLHPWYWPGI